MKTETPRKILQLDLNQIGKQQDPLRIQIVKQKSRLDQFNNSIYNCKKIPGKALTTNISDKTKLLKDFFKRALKSTSPHVGQRRPDVQALALSSSRRSHWSKARKGQVL